MIKSNRTLTEIDQDLRQMEEYYRTVYEELIKLKEQLLGASGAGSGIISKLENEGKFKSIWHVEQKIKAIKQRQGDIHTKIHTDPVVMSEFKNNRKKIENLEKIIREWGD